MSLRRVVIVIALVAHGRAWSSPPPSPVQAVVARLTADQRDQLRRALDQRSPDTAEGVLARLTWLKDAMCACTDSACVARVNDELAAYATERSNTGAGRPALGPDAQKRAAEIGKEASACIVSATRSSARMTDAQRYVEMNAQFKDELCACKDLACARAAAARMTRWSEDFLAHPHDRSKMNDAGQQRMEALERDVQACMRALR